MKILGIAATSGLFLLSSAAFAGGCHVLGSQQGGESYNGPTNCVDTTVTNITVNGPFNASETTVKGGVVVRGPAKVKELHVGGDFSVFGPLNAKQLTVIGKLVVQGPLKVKDAKLKTVTVNGPVKIDESTISSSLNYAANEGVIDDSTVADITVRGSSYKPAILCLDKTRVTGEVAFVGTKGTIYLKDGAVVTGSVAGGSTVKGDCPD